MCYLGLAASSCALFNPVLKCNKDWLVIVVALTVLLLLFSVTSTPLSLKDFPFTVLKSSSSVSRSKTDKCLWAEERLTRTHFEQVNKFFNPCTAGTFLTGRLTPRRSWIIKLSPCDNCPAKLFKFVRSKFSAAIGKASEPVIWKHHFFILIVLVLPPHRFAAPSSTRWLDVTMMILPLRMPSVKDCVTFVQIYLAAMMQYPQRCVVVNAVIILYSFSISTSKPFVEIPL